MRIHSHSATHCLQLGVHGEPAGANSARLSQADQCEFFIGLYDCGHLFLFTCSAQSLCSFGVLASLVIALGSRFLQIMLFSVTAPCLCFQHILYLLLYGVHCREVGKVSCDIRCKMEPLYCGHLWNLLKCPV